VLEVYAENLDENGNPIPGDHVDIGWQTADMDAYPVDYAGEAFMNDATYYRYDYGMAVGHLEELVIENVSRDLAFVITPEPATLGLLALGCLALHHRLRRT
jgi:hypothetical protein